MALAKLTAMIIGGLSMGYLLSRQVRTSLLFGLMVVVGLIAQTILFLPAGGMTLATFALVLCLFALPLSQHPPPGSPFTMECSTCCSPQPACSSA